jgi:predicted dehydrogenase
VPRRRARREPVVVALIGAGSASRAYLRTLDALVASGTAVDGPVCDRRAKTRRELVARRPSTRAVATVDEVLASDIDLVLITTAPDSHAALTRQALDAGKHVVVEKPFASDPDEGRALADLARTNGLLLAVAPFVQLSPAFGMLRAWVRAGVLGQVHSARAMYGNPGSTWASWYHASGVGPLGDLAIYNLKSLTALLGPVREVRCLQSRSSIERESLKGREPDPDVVHLMLRHEQGATSSVMASHAVWAYRRPAIELYGSEGTANLLGDDWDPEGIEVFRESWGHWREYPSPDRTWNWTDGLRSAVEALRSGRWDVFSLDHDIHVLDVVDACRRSAAGDGTMVAVTSTFGDLQLVNGTPDTSTHVHDHTRPPGEQ